MSKRLTTGFIKLPRNIQDWDWYGKPNIVMLWIHILLNANYEDVEWRGEIIERGSLVTSVSSLANETGLTESQVRAALKRLTISKQIVKQTTNKTTKIIVCDYDSYQGLNGVMQQTNDEQNDKQITNETTTIGEDKKERIEEKKDANASKEKKPTRFVRPTVEQVRAYCAENHYQVNAAEFVDFYESKGWVVGKSPMKDWKAAVRTWVRKEREEKGLPAQVTPKPSLDKPSLKEAIEQAKNPTKEEKAKFWHERVEPFFPRKKDETDEAYRERMKPIYKSQYKSWIEDRVLRTKQKYL